MVTKWLIMHEWREFVRRKDAMIEMYTQDKSKNRDTEPSPRYLPESPARAPAYLCEQEHPEQVQDS